MSGGEIRRRGDCSVEINIGLNESKATYPFLVHSQQSLSHRTPPDIDNHRLARQKRRRTSPEDHAILEAEYERNSKPDKLARLQIVSKVALGEKEVQIWFQNRRQVTRRKSRPLLAHEILANLQTPLRPIGHSSSPSDDLLQRSQHMQSSSQSSAANPLSQTDDADVEIPSHAARTADQHDRLQNGQDHPVQAETCVRPLGADMSRLSNEGTSNTHFGPVSGKDEHLRSGGLSRSKSQILPRARRPEDFGARRSASFMIQSAMSDAGEFSLNSSCLKDMEQSHGLRNIPTSSRSLQRSSSLMRLSMSLDGKAQVTTSSGTTPSPPRSKAFTLINSSDGPRKSLQRSFSAIEPSEKNDSKSLANPSIRRHATGRSRDARTWEFYCDKDTRDALTEQAEREESGSATAAIALIKSNSNVSRMLAVKSNKRNKHTAKPEAAKKPRITEQPIKRPKIGRSQSLYDDMNLANDSSQPAEMKAGIGHRKRDSQSGILVFDEGDSDKENWAPGTQQRSPQRQRRTGPNDSRRVLEENLRYSANRSAFMSQKRTTSLGSTSSISSDGKENKAPGTNEEATNITAKPFAHREADDLDCVQNLLSLSQATWQ